MNSIPPKILQKSYNPKEARLPEYHMVTPRAIIWFLELPVILVVKPLIKSDVRLPTLYRTKIDVASCPISSSRPSPWLPCRPADVARLQWPCPEDDETNHAFWSLIFHQLQERWWYIDDCPRNVCLKKMNLMCGVEEFSILGVNLHLLRASLYLPVIR